jgi:hypothetical protein
MQGYFIKNENKVKTFFDFFSKSKKLNFLDFEKL